MAKLTEQQKYKNQLNRALQKALKNNQKEKYPIPLEKLAHNFWEDYPKFRNENQDKQMDKFRIWQLLSHKKSQISNL